MNRRSPTGGSSPKRSRASAAPEQRHARRAPQVGGVEPTPLATVQLRIGK